ncbi:MAG TPA: FHA domain-containing protein [Pyrinomonadaceae bacterium]|nr:FHA domain-containing protein [Pyrinomonadaceae bacterium]
MSKKLLVKNRDTIVPELTREIPENGIFSVGNDLSATLELKDNRIAPEQFVIVCEGNQATLMCRADGGQINGQSLSQGSLHNLQPKDVINVGDYTLIFDTAKSVEAIIASFVANGSAQENSAASDLPQKKQTSRKKTGGQSETADSQRSLNDVLEELRSDEKFYFQVEDADGEKRRFYVETEEMWLGWSAAGECVIGKNTADIEIPRAQIRKDWSGVVLYPLQTEAIRLNSEMLSEPHRLKNDDHLLLLAKNKAQFDETMSIKFHEPTALLVLDSILPKKLPPPVLIKTAAQTADNSLKSSIDGGEADRQTIQSTARTTISKGKKSRIFGYFTLTEISVMTVGTLIASVIIFFVLEYF